MTFAFGSGVRATKKRHILDGRTYCAATERYEVYALCGYGEEASGSGRHTVDVGDEPCEECARIAERDRRFDEEDR